MVQEWKMQLQEQEVAGRQGGQEGEGQQDPTPPSPARKNVHDNKRQQLTDPHMYRKGSDTRAKANGTTKPVYPLFTTNGSTKTVPIYTNSVPAQSNAFVDHTILTSTTTLPSTDEFMRLRKEIVTNQHKSAKDAADVQAVREMKEKELKRRTTIKEKERATSETAGKTQSRPLQLHQSQRTKTKTLSRILSHQSQ